MNKTEIIKNLKRFGLSKTRIIFFAILSTGTAFLEGFGIAMFLPLFEFIEKRQDITALSGSSELWKRIVLVFDFLGMETTIVSLLGVIFFLMILRIVSKYARNIYSAWLTQDILHNTRTHLFSAYLGARYSVFDQHSTGKVINLTTTETQRIGGSFSSLFALVSYCVMILGYIIVMMWLSLMMTIFTVVFLSVAGLLVNYFVRNTREISRQTTDSNKDFSEYLVERLMAFRLIKLTATTKRETDKAIQRSIKVRNHNYWLSMLNARVDLLLEPIVVFCAVIILYSSVTYFNLTLSEMGLFLFVLLRLLPLSSEFLRSRQTFLSCSGSLEAILEGFAIADKEQEKNKGQVVFEEVKKEITLSNVTFTYGNQSKPAVYDLNVSIPAGKMTALVGPSGAGKSTLVDFFPYMRIPQSGDILFDGISINKINLETLRKKIAFVSQDTFIFNDTVSANIAFTRSKVDEEEVWQVLEKAKATEFVKGLPDGLNTILGERGMRLSGGQKQRISLARALMQNAPVLILDEPTSALDSEVENDIQSSIDDLRNDQNVTIIVIAHRLSTIRKADKIVVLKEGRVIQEGTHEELLSSKDWYALVNGMQAGTN